MNSKNIVLLHGWGAKISKLKPLKIELENLGWKVMLPKLPGFDMSPPKKVWNIKNYSDFVYKKALREFEKENFFVFGHSFGGGIAIKLTEKRSKFISGIILCATRGISRGRLVKRLLFNTLAKTGKIFLINKDLANGFRKILYKAAREHDYEKTDGIMREIFKKIISEDLKPQVRKIKVPVLIFWGRVDKITPLRDAFYIRSVLPECRLKIYKEQSHGLPYEKPNVLAEEINIWYKSLA